METSGNHHQYDDIIHLPHHQSSLRPHMPLRDRAAQFSPFAALTGYDQAVEETARLTDERHNLGEDARDALDEKLGRLLRAGGGQQVSITYFEPDMRKKGGAYQTVHGNLKTYDNLERAVVLEDGTRIPADSILDLESDAFSC